MSCFTCLSYNKRLFPLGKYFTIFERIISGTIFNTRAIQFKKNEVIRICWECKARLKNCYDFLNEIEAANRKFCRYPKDVALPRDEETQKSNNSRLVVSPCLLINIPPCTPFNESESTMKEEHIQLKKDLRSLKTAVDCEDSQDEGCKIFHHREKADDFRKNPETKPAIKQEFEDTAAEDNIATTRLSNASASNTALTVKKAHLDQTTVSNSALRRTKTPGSYYQSKTGTNLTKSFTNCAYPIQERKKLSNHSQVKEICHNIDKELETNYESMIHSFKIFSNKNQCGSPLIKEDAPCYKFKSSDRTDEDEDTLDAYSCIVAESSCEKKITKKVVNILEKKVPFVKLNRINAVPYQTYELKYEKYYDHNYASRDLYEEIFQMYPKKEKNISSVSMSRTIKNRWKPVNNELELVPTTTNLTYSLENNDLLIPRCSSLPLAEYTMSSNECKVDSVKSKADTRKRTIKNIGSDLSNNKKTCRTYKDTTRTNKGKYFNDISYTKPRKSYRSKPRSILPPDEDVMCFIPNRVENCFMKSNAREQNHKDKGVHTRRSKESAAIFKDNNKEATSLKSGNVKGKNNKISNIGPNVEKENNKPKVKLNTNEICEIYDYDLKTENNTITTHIVDLQDIVIKTEEQGEFSM